MLDFKMCPKCGNSTAKENEICPNCGYNFEKDPDHNIKSQLFQKISPESSLKVSSIEKTPIKIKKVKPNSFFFVGILFLLILALLIVVPTKTVIKNVEVSYLDTENYTDQEPYTAMEITYLTETWQEVHTTSEGHESPEGYYWNKCAAPCRCTHYTDDPQTVPSHYCDECSCPKSGTYEQSRTVPKYEWITKYREVNKTRIVTKIRMEPQPAEVNWIFGFNAPYAFHLL